MLIYIFVYVRLNTIKKNVEERKLFGKISEKRSVFFVVGNKSGKHKNLVIKHVDEVQISTVKR